MAVRGRLVVVAIHATPPPVNLFRVFWRELTLIGARVYERADFGRGRGVARERRRAGRASDHGVDPLARRRRRLRDARGRAGDEAPDRLRGRTVTRAADLFDLTGKLALVTGCRRGLGLAMADALAQSGADVIGASAQLEQRGAKSSAASKPPADRSRASRSTSRSAPR